ncbi:hypothetical protein VP01_761g9 [Puccinia sorghi]|uniref:Uncharacterized protein n=1 Tax=Puccinia sorghi TaxID=27349 RepID=A0A0L6UBW4_9BASI|nr:hypothetical protein VP01_761g9 [Puccinia sorghi]
MLVKTTTLKQAQKWRDLESEAQGTQAFQENGVQWSELNRLPYWDPVMNISPGIMHNWQKGVLQNHFCFRCFFTHWGIKITQSIWICIEWKEQLHENRVLIDNTCLLVHCTNVLYSETSVICFPGLKFLPNHHFALHIPAQLQWWSTECNFGSSWGKVDWYAPKF